MNSEYHDEDDLEGEIAISFSPRFEDLTRLGITSEQFEAALLDALEEFEALSAREDTDPDELNLEDISLHIGGTSYRLADLADIEISSEDDEEFETDDEDDEDEDEGD